MDSPAAASRVRVVELDDVEADHFQFYLVDTSQSLPEALPDEDDLSPCVMTAPGLVIVGTASYGAGHLPVRLEFHEREPALDLAAFDQVVDVSLGVRGSELFVGYEAGPSIPCEPGSWRVRIAGRDLDLAADVEPGGDSYVIQLWPAPEAPRVVHKRWQRDERDWSPLRETGRKLAARRRLRGEASAPGPAIPLAPG